MTRFDEELTEEEKEFIREMKKVSPHVTHPDGMPDTKAPTRDIAAYDGSYPSKVSVSLDECPECGGPMHDGAEVRTCRLCAKQQPIMTLTKDLQMFDDLETSPISKHSYAQALLGLVRGLGSAVARGGAAAGAEGGAAGGSGGLGGLMNGAMSGGAMPGGSGPMAPLQQAMQTIKDIGGDGAAMAGSAMPEQQFLAAASDERNDTNDAGADDFPFGGETQGFNEGHGDPFGYVGEGGSDIGEDEEFTEDQLAVID